jgi:hypothetical protein
MIDNMYSAAVRQHTTHDTLVSQSISYLLGPTL